MENPLETPYSLKFRLDLIIFLKNFRGYLYREKFLGFFVGSYIRKIFPKIFFNSPIKKFNGPKKFFEKFYNKIPIGNFYT